MSTPKMKWSPSFYSFELLQYLKTNSMFSRFAHAAFWSIAGAVISRGLILLASVFMARILGQTGFGQIGMVQSTMGTLGTFAGLGLGMASTKYVAYYRSSHPTKAGKILALSSLVSVLSATIFSITLIFLAPLLAELALNCPQLSTPLRIGSGLVFFGVINGVQTGALAGFEAFRSIARVNLFTGLISFPFSVAGTLMLGINGAVIGLVLATGVNCWLNNRALTVRCKDLGITSLFKDCWTDRLVLWEFTLPTMLSVALVSPIAWFSNVLLVNQSNGYAAMGIFSAAQQWQTAILFLPTSLGPMILSLLANTHGGNNPVNYWRMVRMSFLFNGIITAVAAFFVFLFSSKIMSFYGKGFSDGWLVLTLLAITAFLMAVINVIGQVIASSASMWWGALMNLSWAIAFIGFSFLWVHKYGAVGLAVAYLASYLCHLIWTGFYILKHKQLIEANSFIGSRNPASQGGDESTS